jgi:hypothetical protein
MIEEQDEKLEALMKEVDCPKGYTCVKSNLDRLCRARDHGLKKHLICLENDPGACPLASCYGSGYLCACPVRIYISKELRK